MSFRLFIYYCAVCGGNAAFFGWVLGRFVVQESATTMVRTGLRGLFLGMFLAFGLGLVDALWNLSVRHFLVVVSRVLVAVTVGSLGGLLGGMLGQSLYGWTQWPVTLILGWTITGILIGVSLGVFDLLACLVRQADTRGARRKLFNGLLGGSLGGGLGGLLFVLILAYGKQLFGEGAEHFWIPSATGFVALGMCIGLLIGLCQVILKEAWLRVEKGFRVGRELLLSQPEITLGRAESCDLGLFGDPAIEKIHARIKRQEDDYLLCDEGTASGTWVNDVRIEGLYPLHSGDLIRMGRSLVRFGERHKRASDG